MCHPRGTALHHYQCGGGTRAGFFQFSEFCLQLVSGVTPLLCTVYLGTEFGDFLIMIFLLVEFRSGWDFAARFIHLIVIGEHSVVLHLFDGVVLVVMTLGAAKGEPEENLAGGRDPVEDGIDPELFAVHATLGVDLCVAMKAGCNALCRRSIGEHVASQLLDDKLIERQIIVGGADDPIAVLPHYAGSIVAVTIAIGITGGVQPMASPAFSVSGRGQ